MDSDKHQRGRQARLCNGYLMNSGTDRNFHCGGCSLRGLKSPVTFRGEDATVDQSASRWGGLSDTFKMVIAKRHHCWWKKERRRKTRRQDLQEMTVNWSGVDRAATDRSRWKVLSPATLTCPHSGSVTC